MNQNLAILLAIFAEYRHFKSFYLLVSISFGTVAMMLAERNQGTPHWAPARGGQCRSRQSVG
jgi:hypothetical protein